MWYRWLSASSWGKLLSSISNVGNDTIHQIIALKSKISTFCFAALHPPTKNGSYTSYDKYEIGQHWLFHISKSKSMCPTRPPVGHTRTHAQAHTYVITIAQFTFALGKESIKVNLEQSQKSYRNMTSNKKKYFKKYLKKIIKNLKKWHIAYQHYISLLKFLFCFEKCFYLPPPSWCPPTLT